MTITTADVLDNIKHQLDWRGPSGKGQGHIVLGRPEAEFLHERVLDLIRTQDRLIKELEAATKNPQPVRAGGNS